MAAPHDFGDAGGLPDGSVPLQLVYISVRPDLIPQSIASFRLHYGADRAIVLTGDGLKPEMEAALQGAGLAGHVLTDSQVLPGQQGFTDHAERNCRLREALYRHDLIEPYFLSLDDDCILLRDLPRDHFVSDGRMVARYTHASLAKWKASPLGEPTSFDRMEWNTAAILDGAGLPDLGFAAHQAQIFDKASANAIYAEFLQQVSGPVDEWSLYFNVACARQPGRFVARPATTLFWPESFDAWLPDWFADEVWFENRYPSLYGKAGAAAGAGLHAESDWRAKRAWVAANYAAHHGQRLLNELSNGQPPALQLAFDKAGEACISTGASQLFGYPGMILKLAVTTADAGRQPLEYAIVMGGQPVAECASPPQLAGPRGDLAVRLPSQAGEYSFIAKWTYEGQPAYVSLPLFVLPYPRLA